MKWKQGWGEYNDIKYLELFGIKTKSFFAAMNYQQFEEKLSSITNQQVRDKWIEWWFFRYQSYSDTLIKLHKNHIPLHPKVCIQTQKSYDFYMETLFWLLDQLKRGVEPAYFVTFHYQHPSERVKQIRETNLEEGFGDRIGFIDLCGYKYYKYWSNKRNCEDQLSKDTRHLKNLLMKNLYGIKRLNRSDKKEFPNLFFFHEKGKVKLQYHTHLLIPKKNLKPEFDNETELHYFFDNFIRKKRKCLSKWKNIDVRPVTNKEGVIGYLNKETNPNHISFDFINSIPVPIKNN